MNQAERLIAAVHRVIALDRGDRGGEWNVALAELDGAVDAFALDPAGAVFVAVDQGDDSRLRNAVRKHIGRDRGDDFTRDHDELRAALDVPDGPAIAMVPAFVRDIPPEVLGRIIQSRLSMGLRMVRIEELDEIADRISVRLVPG